MSGAVPRQQQSEPRTDIAQRGQAADLYADDDPSVIDQISASFRLTSDDMAVVQDVQLGDAYARLASDLEEAGVDRSLIWRTSPTSPWLARTADRSFWGQEVVDRDAIFGVVNDLRRRNPSQWRSIPQSRAEFDRAVLTGRAGRAADLQTQAYSSLLPQLAGGGAALFQDPMQLLALPLGGGGGSYASIFARSMAVNAAAEAALGTPDLIVSRAARGESTSASEIALNIGAAGLVGGFLETGGEALGRWLTRGADLANAPEQELADVLAATPPEARTPDQQAAMNVLQRQADVDAANPYIDDGAGLDAHAQRLAAAMEDLYSGGRTGARMHSEAPAAREVSPVVGAEARQQFKAAVRRSESGGNDRARNPQPGQTASGRYQFIQGTFTSLYARVYGVSRNEATRAWNSDRRFAPDVQERLMDAAIDDYQRVYRSAGVPATPGNLYLAHFFGPDMAVRVLRAAPDTPIGSIVGQAAVDANRRVLAGKSASEVIAWTHRAMGDTADSVGARSAADMTGPDIAVRPAALDADPVAVLRAADGGVDVPPIRAEGPDAGADSPVPPLRAQPDVPSPAPTAPDVPVLRRELFPDDVSWRIAQSAEQARAEGLATPEVTRASVWAEARQQLEAVQGGEVPGALFHPETGPIDVKWGDATAGYAKIMARHPEVLDRLPELIEQMAVKSRSANRVVLQSADNRAVVRLDYDGQQQTWLLSAYQLKGKAPPPADYRGAGSVAQDLSPTRGTATDIGEATATRNPGRADAAAVRAAGYGDEPATRFDDAHGSDARAQADGLAHDLRAVADEGGLDGVAFQTGDGAAESVARALARLDADDAALQALRRCL